MPTTPRRCGTTAAAPLRAATRALVERLGVAAAARAIGIDSATVARVVAELPVAHGTIAILRARLPELDGVGR